MQAYGLSALVIAAAVGVACGQGRESRAADAAVTPTSVLASTRASASASVSASTPAPAPAPASASVLGMRTSFVHERLSNGLQVVVSRDRSAPLVVVDVMYRVGSRLESEGRSGFAHLFEHMMFQGSAQVPAGEFQRRVNEAGGRFHGATRADYTNYFNIAPARALERLLWLEADRMRALAVTSEKFEAQRRSVLEEVRQQMLNQPHQGMEFYDLPKAAFVKWANAHNSYGELADLQGANLADARAFHRTWYVPNNACVIIVGDVEPDEALRLARGWFGDIPARPLPARPDVSEAGVSGGLRERIDPLAQTLAVAVGYRLPPRLSQDFWALVVLDALLVRQEAARLPRAFEREGVGVASVTGAMHLLGTPYEVEGPGLYTLRVEGAPDVATAANADASGDTAAARAASAERRVPVESRWLGIVDRELAAIAASGVPDDELRSGKAMASAAFVEEIDGPTQANAGRARLLGVFTLFDGDPGLINQVLPKIDAVTVDDVRRVAGEYFGTGRRTVVVSRPREAGGEVRSGSMPAGVSRSGGS